MYDALARLFESQNINRRMTLRTQLKMVKMEKLENIQSYLSRVSQIKEQIHAIGDMVEEVEVVMTTLNGLPRSWESFIQGVCSRRKMPEFNKLWEDCIPEEPRIVVRDEKLGRSKDQALFVCTKKGKGRSNHSPKRFQKGPKKDYSTFKCFKCQVLGHIARDCPRQDPKKKSKRKFHAHVAEEEVLIFLVCLSLWYF